MKLLIAAIIFAATLGMLLLIETGKSPKEDSAQIIEALKEENASAAASTTPSQLKTQPSTPIKILSPTPLPASQSPSRTPSATFTPIPTPSLTSQPTPTQSGKININTASAEELDNITGIGPAYAKNIIDYRNANGPFQKIEDIINVSGIGPKTFEKMRDEITI